MRRISVSVDRLVAEIASSDFFASAGSVSMTCAPTPACTAITPIEWATTSCRSWAMRKRSSATARLASSSRSRSSDAVARFQLFHVQPAVANRRPEEVRGGEDPDVRGQARRVEAGRAEDTQQQEGERPALRCATYVDARCSTSATV